MGVYTFASKPTTPGERTPDLLIRFQAVSRTQPCVQYRFMSVHSRTKLTQVRRHITKYFKTVYETGFVFLCKTKEILKSDENKLTVFDILPKIPEIHSCRTPTESFQYPDVQYKKVWYNYDGKRYHCTCACVIFLFERSKVSHWPQEVLREELAASAIDGFSTIPTDIISWSGKLVECRGTPLHIYAALGKKEELKTAIHQLVDGTTAKALKDQRGATPLHYAAANGKLDECEILVAGFGSEMIYHTDNWERSPLHRALYRRKAPTITYLIQMNADVDTPDDTGNSCIELLYRQKPKDVEFIVSKLETDCVDNRVRCCLMYLSMINKKFSHVRKIANSIDPASETQLGTTFLHFSAKFKLNDVTKSLLDRGFERSEQDLMGFLPFHVACKHGAFDQISLLLYDGISDADLNKGIQLSIRYDQMEACRPIHAFRPNIELEETTVCMIMSTVQSMLRKFKLKTIDEEPLKHFENVASMLLPITKSLPDVLNAFVFDCALYGASESLILLKSLGASFNTCDYSGRSPLHEAAQANKLRCTQVLLKGGANPNITDWRGSTPLHYACAKGNNNIVKCLMEDKNVKANITDVHGRTPLLVAGYHRRDETIVYLLKYCDKVVDLTVCDNQGFGLLHYGLLLKETTLDLVIEKLSGKPKPLYEENGSKTKRKIKDSSWIPIVINTSFRAIVDETAYANNPRQAFKLIKDDKMALWKTREENLRWSRTVKKPPQIEYEKCSGCRKLMKPSTKHICPTPKDKRNKKTNLEAFKFHDESSHHKISMVSPFYIAVKIGNIQAMKKIRKLDSKASSYRDEFGRNCLELAIDLRSMRLVKAVIELCSEIDKSQAIQRVVALPKGSKKESTQLQMLVYLFSVNCKMDSSKDHSQGDLVFSTAIKGKNSDIIEELANNAEIINDQTMVLAASSGVPAIVERVFKKWRKNKSRKLDVVDIIGVACSSQNLSAEVVNYLLTHQKTKSSTEPQNSEESGKYADNLCKSLQIPFVKRKSLLGKLLYKKHPAKSARPSVSSAVFNDIGHLIVNHYQSSPNSSVHVACECLQDCIEMQCFSLAETIIKKSSVEVWNCCELAENRCSFQKYFQKKMYNIMTRKLVDVSFLQSLILIAAQKDVPEKILHLILKNGANFFKSEEGADIAVDIDIFQNSESFDDVEKVGDNMIRLALTVLELLTGEQFMKQNLLKIWKQVPGALHHVYLLSKTFAIDECVKTKEDQFLRHCYRYYKDKTDEPNGTSLLHMACGWQDTGALKMVLKAAIPLDVNSETSDGVTPVDVAATFGHWQHYKLLMDNGGQASSPATLERCCLTDVDLVQTIVEPTDNVMFENWSKWLRKRQGQRPDGLQPKSRLKIVQDVWSRLEVANEGKILKDDSDIANACCLFMLWEIVEFFLEKGTHLIINALHHEKGLQSQTSETISMICKHGPISVMKKFLDLIDKNVKKLPEKAMGEIILYLVIRNDVDICNHLINKTLASLNTMSYEQLLRTTDNTGKTVWHHLAINGNIETLTFLISKIPGDVQNSPLDIRDKSKSEPLWYALQSQHWACAELLLIGGCTPFLLRGVLQFDTKRRFEEKKRRALDKIFPKECITLDQQEGKKGHIKRSALPDYWGNHGYRYSLRSREGGSLSKISKTRLKIEGKEEEGYQGVKVVKTSKSKGHKRTQELFRYCAAAKTNGAELIHVAFAVGDQQLITKITEIRPSVMDLKDSKQLLPVTHELINGQEIKERTFPLVKDSSQLKCLVEKFLSFGNRSKRVMYSLRQLRFYIDKVVLNRAELSHMYDDYVICQNPHKFQILEPERKFLCKIFQESTIRDFVSLHEHINGGEFECDRYSFFSREQSTDKGLGDLLKRELLNYDVNEITNDIWTLLFMSGDAWVFDMYLELTRKSKTRQMSHHLLLDLTVFDLLPLFVRSSEKADHLRLRKKNIEKVKALLQSEKGLSLNTDMVQIAVRKQLWSYLEVIGQHTLVETGVLNPVWQTVMAKASQTGNLSFIKSILNSLEVSKMSTEQKACFTAFICISALYGRLDTVKHLVRCRIPLLCSPEDQGFQNLLHKHYVAPWGVLEYALKGNSSETFEFLLQCYKEDRAIRHTVKVKVLLDIAAENGNVKIFKLLSRYADKEAGLAYSRSDLDLAYKKALVKGRENFCLELLENGNTSLVVNSENNTSSLHFAAIHGMLNLASKIVEKRPEILNQTDHHGYTALDYANACGSITIVRLLNDNKAEFSNFLKQSECYGWFHAYMIENRKTEQIEVDLAKTYKSRIELDLLSVLNTGNDRLGEFIISNSRHLIKEQLRSNFSYVVTLYVSAARHGCDKSLNQLLQMISNDENLITRIMSYETKNRENILSCAIVNSHTECIGLIMDFDISWNHNDKRDNALHTAALTGNLEIFTLVDQKSKGTLQTQPNQDGATPNVYVVALGNHHIVANQSSETSLVSTAHEHHDALDRTDYYCIECLLDLCIGWSKLYLKQGDLELEERPTRPVHTGSRFCRMLYKRQKAIITFGQHYNKVNHETVDEHLLTTTMRQIPDGCTIWKQQLICLGFSNTEDDLHELLLRLPSYGNKPLITKMKQVMAKPKFTKAITRMVENGISMDDLLFTAAACGNIEFLKKFGNKEFLADRDKASLEEIAFAFGNTKAALYLQENSNTIYEIFKDLSDALPMRVKWLTGIEKPGSETWLKSINQDPVYNHLSMADFWIVSNFTDDTVKKICSDVDLNVLIPQTLADKKYNVDIESFKRNNPSCSSDINHRIYISSSLVYGRQLTMFANNGSEKLKMAQNIKVLCEPSGPGNLPKIHVDLSGNYQEAVVFSQTNSSGIAILTDNSFVQKIEETMVRNCIMNEVVPTVSSLVKDIFQKDVTLKIDWQSLESRRRTGNYDLLLKLLSGESNRNLLGGLLDVLEQCTFIRQDISDMYDETTVHLALQPLSHINEVVVTYVDTLQGSDTARKPRSTAMSDILTWEFTYEKNTLKYNRESFPLLTTLMRYQRLGGAVCNALHRICNIETDAKIDKIDIEKEKRPKKNEKRLGRITLEIDIKSFGVKNGTMIHEKLCQGVSREVDAIAGECEAMLRLTIKANRVLFRNCASAQGTGISLQESTVTVSVCLSMNSQKALTVERGQIRQKLEELEDQQVFSSWNSEKLGPVKRDIEEISRVLQSENGFSIQITFDEKRLMAFVFQRYRREMTHPHELFFFLLQNLCFNLSVTLKMIVLKIIDGVSVDYLMDLEKDNTVPDGIWTKVPSKDVNHDPKKTYTTLNLVKIKPYCYCFEKLIIGGPEYYNITVPRKAVYSCDLKNKKTTGQLYQHSDFDTTRLFPRIEKKMELELISLFGHLYRITDVKRFNDVLSQFPWKINITTDLILESESESLLSLNRRLSSELESTLRNRKLLNKNSIIREIDNMLLNCFNEWDVLPPDTMLDFDSFEMKSKSDLDSTREIEHSILLAAYRFEDALLKLTSKFRLCKEDREPLKQCMRFTEIKEGLRGILQKVRIISIRKASEDQQASNSKKSKVTAVSNPSMQYSEGEVQIILNNSPINNSLETAMEKLISSIVMSSLSNMVLKQVSIETGIGRKLLDVSHKVSSILGIEYAALWYNHLYRNGVLDLSSFDDVKVEKQCVIFRMQSPLNLDICVSLKEKPTEDHMPFRKLDMLRHGLKVEVYDGDLTFLRFGENKLRIKCNANGTDTVDQNLFRFEIDYKKSTEDRTTKNLKLSTKKCQVVEEGVQCLFFDIPNEMEQKLYDATFLVFFKDENVRAKSYQYVKVLERFPAKGTTVTSSGLNIKKEGWVKLGVQHETHKTAKHEETRVYRHVQQNTITDVISERSLRYTLTYTQSFMLYRQKNSEGDFRPVDPVTINNGILRVQDESTEVKVSVQCQICGEALNICLPFPEISPRPCLVINKMDTMEDDD